ncbi:SDR family oxidoreductase [Kitasatospora sp. NBC_00315]|uniref:SDR family oxidoreductase n=1 Tax=Kitasatospora sp. NBC_00315 TaxID=2975963 RepID=UPI003253CF39
MPGDGSVTLVTGATGFLGSALAVRLVEQREAVRCVVRGATAAERAARLWGAFDGRVAEEDRHLVEVVAGDLAQERLGLPAAGFEALGENVSQVVHCGARVNMTLPYGPLYGTNVRATEELLALAQARAASFGYVSSLAAVARDVTGEPFELTDPVSGGYGQSKWSADRLVSVAHQEGRLRAVILRPGRITAHSRTARSNPDDLLERVLRVSARLGAVPLLDTRIRLSPVDWVSRLVVALCGTERAHGRAHHLIAPVTLPWAAVPAALRRAGYRPQELAYPHWRAAVVDAGRDDPAVARLSQALPPERLSFDDRIGSEPRNAAAALAGEYPEPPPAETLLADTVAAWQRTGELPVGT